MEQRESSHPADDEAEDDQEESEADLLQRRHLPGSWADAAAEVDSPMMKKR
jgi:hypothetical protein